MEETFKIRTYGFAELACLYLPQITQKSASNQLRNWIKLNQNLKNELYLSGLKPKQKVLTPKQVSILVNHLGEP